MNTVVLPAGWEGHAAPAANLLDPLGRPLMWWGAGALFLVAAIALIRVRPGLSTSLALFSTLALAIAANGLVDDAFIQFRYAANLAAGHGPVFNPGERVEGASGGIWIGVVALTSALTDRDPARCGRVLSLLAATLATGCAAAFGRAVGGGRGAAFAAIVWAALPTAALYAATGLETSAFASALWGLGAAVASDRRFPAAAAGACAATLRPEGIVLALGAAPFWRRLGSAGRAALLGSLCGGVAIALARLAYYGLPVPRSALVKGVITTPGAEAGLRYLGQAAFEWWPLLPALLWIAPRWRSLLPILVPAALWTCLVVTRGGDWMPGGRYLVPLVVVLAIGATARLASGAAGWLGIGSVAWGLLLLMPVQQPLAQPSRLPVGWAWRAMVEHRTQSRWWEALGAWMRQTVPPGTFLAAGPSGALPYASRLRTFDLYGLCSPVTRSTGGEAGHRLWGLDQAVAAGADLIYPGRELLLVESPDSVLPVARVDLHDAPDVLQRYRPVTISHVPEYRLDFLRDVLWVRRDFAGVLLSARNRVPARAPLSLRCSVPTASRTWPTASPSPSESAGTPHGWPGAT